MSFLIATDLLSMLERKRVPPKLAAWVRENESEIFLSIAATALFHGHTVATHKKRHFEATGVQLIDPLT